MELKTNRLFIRFVSQNDWESLVEDAFSESRVTTALFLLPEGGGYLYPVSNAECLENTSN